MKETVHTRVNTICDIRHPCCPTKLAAQGQQTSENSSECGSKKIIKSFKTLWGFFSMMLKKNQLWSLQVWTL